VHFGCIRNLYLDKSVFVAKFGPSDKHKSVGNCASSVMVTLYTIIYCLFAPHIYGWCSSHISRWWWIADSAWRQPRGWNTCSNVGLDLWKWLRVKETSNMQFAFTKSEIQIICNHTSWSNTGHHFLIYQVPFYSMLLCWTTFAILIQSSIFIVCSSPILIRLYCPNIWSNPVYIRINICFNIWFQWSKQFGYPYLIR